MKASILWKKFLLENKKIVTSEYIRDLAEQISKDSNQVIDYLQRQDYITRILRGIFYVKSIEERVRSGFDHSIYEMVAMALKKKGVESWYFGLETALKMNEMTHEYFTVDYVLTDSFRTTKVIRIIDNQFKFIKRSKKYFKDGIVTKKRIRYSDVEKTVLDLAYQYYLKDNKTEFFLSPVREYKDRIDGGLMQKYVEAYPRMFRNGVEGLL